jgi:type IX secretion system substrate protein
VYITGSYYTKVSNNPLIKCTGLTYFPPSVSNPYVYGVYVSQSPNSHITCNAATALGIDFCWNSTNTSSFWEENTMHNSNYGLGLSNTGVMGDQGSTSQAIWATFGENILADLSSKQTIVDGTSAPGTAPTSKLYCLAATCSSSGGTPLPCANGHQTGGTAYTASGGSPTLITVTTPTTSPGLCTAEGGTGRMANTTHAATVDSSSLVALLNFSSTDTLPAYNQQTRWATQYVVSSAMNSIPAVSGYENARNFALVDGAMASQNYGAAQSLLGGIAPSNIIESNWSAVDNIVLQLAGGDSLRAGNISTLQTVAAQCPLTGGNIVWRARALLNSYYRTIINYPNNCPVIGSFTEGGAGARVESTTAINQITNNINQVTLYPNPNNGSMTLDYNLNNDAHLEITDITGNLVGTYMLPATETTLQVQSNNLQSGMYMYRIISNNAVIKQGKIVVMK